MKNTQTTTDAGTVVFLREELENDLKKATAEEQEMNRLGHNKQMWLALGEQKMITKYLRLLS